MEYIPDIEDIRQRLMDIESELKQAEKYTKPPKVQEVILARRHVEDARMRLAIAIHMED